MIFNGIKSWICTWLLLHKVEEERKKFNDACRPLETVIMQVCANFGWRCSNRIEA
ncbi:hypothetical protein SORBI_3007G153200 [Sorghum bicolor]|uniref:Uncharacterized protein n=1 Tax=Sorghum bicolor TaxID=4558 RepID=A0A1B6PHZ5_SORBI|nr:hypothetical protein SORBI_3007G153200 [Sorghum bicolor]